MKFALLGAIVGLLAHAVALFGLLVSVAVFGAPTPAASTDPMIYIWAAVLTAVWSMGVASLATPQHAMVAAIAYIAAWVLAGIFTLGVTWWWVLSIGIVTCTAALGWSIGRFLHRRRSFRVGGLAHRK